jgi:hypothetical protein
MLRHVVFVRTDIWLSISSQRASVARTARSQILVPWWRWQYVPPKRLFLQEQHGVIFQKTAFFMEKLIRREDECIQRELPTSIIRTIKYISIRYISRLEKNKLVFDRTKHHVTVWTSVGASSSAIPPQFILTSELYNRPILNYYTPSHKLERFQCCNH